MNGGQSLLKTLLKTINIFICFLFITSCVGNKFTFDENNFTIESSNSLTWIEVRESGDSLSYSITKKDSSQSKYYVINLRSIPDDFVITRVYKDTLDYIEFKNNKFYRIENWSVGDAGPFYVYFKINEYGEVSICRREDFENVKFR